METFKARPYHQIEFITTMYFLRKHLPESGLVFDAEGVLLRCTIELASMEYEVVLLDITPKLLKIARRQIKRAGVQDRLKQIIEGSITDLTAFADEKFDAVLCLEGPLTHLLDAKQREGAAGELVRVAKRGSPLFIPVIGRLGLLRTIPLEFPDKIQDCRHHWEKGRLHSRCASPRPGGWLHRRPVVPNRGAPRAF
ncbi:MAG: Methyltransferase domain protein [Candidatus Bathyarchaeota archaeon BA1]|nr:MAG: Methyltransferase domain protein [Candidatus Bathyarchaeota archaeon BA1]